MIASQLAKFECASWLGSAVFAGSLTRAQVRTLGSAFGAMRIGEPRFAGFGDLSGCSGVGPL